ncbi:MAG: DUF4124 domain-containing protein [Pseudomonadales bacterium]|nr:DUF4124 domain-containing protein [Pseudomonadales bacterium]
MSIVLSLCSSSTLGAESYYMWTDENGVINYSSEEPKGVDATHVEVKHRFGERVNAPSTNDTTIDSVPFEQNLPTGTEDRTTDYEEAADQFLQQAKEAKRESCNRARADLALFQQRGRMRMRDSEGNVRILPDEEKNTRMQQFRRTIDESCSE